MKRRDMFMRIRALAARRRVERELDEELAFHLARETHEQCRDARGTAFVDAVMRDVAYAFRAAVATVLMSTGAASAIGDVVQVLDPAAYTASVLVIVAACLLAASVPAMRAARLDPITTLRQD